MHKRRDENSGLRIAVCASRFNEDIVEGLLHGCLKTLDRHGVPPEQTSRYSVAGAFELPLIAKLCADSYDYHAIICLGAVIQGETAHFEHIASQAVRGTMDVMLTTRVPITLGIITAYTHEQALARSSRDGRNEGSCAAAAALEMAQHANRFQQEPWTLPK